MTRGEQQRPVLPGGLGVGGDRDVLREVEAFLQVVGEHRHRRVRARFHQPALGLDVAQPEAQARFHRSSLRVIGHEFVHPLAIGQVVGPGGGELVTELVEAGPEAVVVRGVGVR